MDEINTSYNHQIYCQVVSGVCHVPRHKNNVTGTVWSLISMPNQQTPTSTSTTELATLPTARLA